ncbi:MAG: hypothetical protein [Bacteriophage sp.]|nr:MAG: hypothetical protein [Bacteriophage sp.]
MKNKTVSNAKLQKQFDNFKQTLLSIIRNNDKMVSEMKNNGRIIHEMEDIIKSFKKNNELMEYVLETYMKDILKQGVTTNKSSNKPKHKSNHRYDKRTYTIRDMNIIRKANQGISHEDIGKEFNITTTRVSQILKRIHKIRKQAEQYHITEAGASELLDRTKEMMQLEQPKPLN